MQLPYLFGAFVSKCYVKKLTWLFLKTSLTGLCPKAPGEDKVSSPYLLIQIIEWKNNIASLHNLTGESGQRFTCFLPGFTLCFPPKLFFSMKGGGKNNLGRSIRMGIWFCCPEIWKNTLQTCEQAYEADNTGACNSQLGFILVIFLIKMLLTSSSVPGYDNHLEFLAWIFPLARELLIVFKILTWHFPSHSYSCLFLTCPGKRDSLVWERGI